MANNTFAATTSNGQYKYGYYTTTDGVIRNGIHVFTTLSKSSQSLVPLISPTSKIELSTMNPNVAIAARTDVIARINGNVYSGGPIGINYEGASGNLYVGATKYATPPAQSSYIYSTVKYSPSFCVKTDGTAVIRWFESPSAMQAAMNASTCIIAGAHPLVFGDKCVTDLTVFDNEPSHTLICDPTLQPSMQNFTRFDFGVVASSPGSTALRTCLGHKSGTSGIYVLVCTDNGISLHDAANLMKVLGCDNAINLDGNGSVQMRIESGYGASGKVTTAIGSTVYAGIAAYTK